MPIVHRLWLGLLGRHAICARPSSFAPPRGGCHCEPPKAVWQSVTPAKRGRIATSLALLAMTIIILCAVSRVDVGAVSATLRSARKCPWGASTPTELPPVLCDIRLIANAKPAPSEAEGAGDWINCMRLLPVAVTACAVTDYSVTFLRRKTTRATAAAAMRTIMVVATEVTPVPVLLSLSSPVLPPC